MTGICAVLHETIGPKYELEIISLTEGQPPILFRLRRDDQQLFCMYMDGRLECGEGYTPDAAAHGFWYALACHQGLRDAFAQYDRDKS